MKHPVIVFDFDGTLVDSQEGIFAGFRHTLKALGLPLDPGLNLYDVIGPPLADSFRKHFGLEGARNDLAVRIYREYYGRQGLYQARLYDGAPETLAALRRRDHKLILATVKMLMYTDRILVNLGIDRYFMKKYGPTGENPHFDKSAALGLVKQEMPQDSFLVVGDRGTDIRAARENGLRSCAATYGYGSREELEREKPNYLIDDIRQVMEVV
jgi:phosphoglycolate phosphatase